MNILSVDYSTSCVGITVRENDKLFFYSIMRVEPKNLPFEDDFTLIIIPKSDDYLLDAIEIANTILYIAGKHECKVATFEGYSFGSKSRSFDLLFECTGIAKAFLRTQGIEVFSYAPTTVKKHFTGKGNSRKLNMFDAFLLYRTDDVIESVFWQRCVEYQGEIRMINRNGEFRGIMKPYEDIIDSYAVFVTHQQSFEQIISQETSE